MSNSRHQNLGKRHSFPKPNRPSPLSDYNNSNDTAASSSSPSKNTRNVSSSSNSVPAATAASDLPSTLISRKRDLQGNLVSTTMTSNSGTRTHLKNDNSTKNDKVRHVHSVLNDSNDVLKSSDDTTATNDDGVTTITTTTTTTIRTSMIITNELNDNEQKQNEDEMKEESNETEDEDDGEDYNYSTTTNIPPQLLSKLSQFPLFKTAPSAFHKAIAGRLKLIQHHAQEYIVKFGEPAKAMYWILRGSVAVTSPDGEMIHTELVPGQFFGEIGILFNRPRTATVIARTKVLLGVLTADNFNAVLPDFPKVERMIRDEAQERLAMQDKRKRNGVTNILPSNNSVSRDAAGGSDDYIGASASNIATANATIPGPSLPPKVRSPSPQLEGTFRNYSLSIKADLPQIHDNVDHSIPTRDFLRSLPMFTFLPSNIIHELVLGVEPRRYDPFEYIFKKGEKGRDIYFIVSGEVEVLDPKRISLVNGNEFGKKVDKVLARLSAGQYFGEMAFLDSIQQSNAGSESDKVEPQRSADIRSISTVDLLIVTGDQLESLYSRYPQIVNEMQETADLRSVRNLKELEYDARILRSEMFERQQQSRSEEFEEATPSVDLFGSFNKWNGFGSESNKKSDEDTTEMAPPPTASTAARVSSCASDFFSSKSSISSSASSTTSSVHRQFPAISSLTNEDPKSKRRQIQAHHQPLQLTPLPLNPSVRSISQFPPRHPSTPAFEYMSHAKRLRLTSIAAGRRRSSVLSTTTLPDRLLLKVFGYLSLPELMKLRFICRRWRQLLYVAPGFFEILDLRPYNLSVTDSALRQITDFVGSRPKVIDISNCFHVTDVGFCYMVNEIGMSGSIKIIRMKSVWEVSAMAIMDVSTPSIGMHLEELDLTNCRKVKDDVIERIIGRKKTTINDSQPTPQQALLLQQQAFELDPIPGMEEFDQIPYNKNNSNKQQAGCPNLRTLNLGYCKHLTDRTMYHISTYLSHKLESLDLTRCISITDQGFAYWAYAQFPLLRRLKLSDCTFLSDRSIIALASSAGNLQSLDLSFCCALSDVAIEALCLGCSKLQELDLSFCGSAVSDSTLLAISIHLRWLRRLIIKGCIRVTRAGIDALLSSSMKLEYLDISQCRNAHFYRNNVPAAQIGTGRGGGKSAFVRNTHGTIVEIVI